jgi:uncharacterized membrane protein YgcG
VHKDVSAFAKILHSRWRVGPSGAVIVVAVADRAMGVHGGSVVQPLLTEAGIAKIDAENSRYMLHRQYRRGFDAAVRKTAALLRSEALPDADETLGKLDRIGKVDQIVSWVLLLSLVWLGSVVASVVWKRFSKWSDELAAKHAGMANAAAAAAGAGAAPVAAAGVPAAQPAEKPKNESQ